MKNVTSVLPDPKVKCFPHQSKPSRYVNDTEEEQKHHGSWKNCILGNWINLWLIIDKATEWSYIVQLCQLFHYVASVVFLCIICSDHTSLHGLKGVFTNHQQQYFDHTWLCSQVIGYPQVNNTSHVQILINRSFDGGCKGVPQRRGTCWDTWRSDRRW